MVDDLARLPSLISRTLETDNAVRQIARRLHRTNNYLYLGRGISYPVAMEGALKLKEISYCHAEGYQAGEMKHGPIALIDEDMPVVALALQDRLYPKMLGNIEEVKARDGKDHSNRDRRRRGHRGEGRPRHTRTPHPRTSFASRVRDSPAAVCLSCRRDPGL